MREEPFQSWMELKNLKLSGGKGKEDVSFCSCDFD